VDDFDRAQDLEMASRNVLIANQRLNIKAITLSHCQDCGDAIPEQRRAVKGVTRCIDCQQLNENIGKYYAR